MAGRWSVILAALALAGCALQSGGRAPRHTGMGRAPSAVDVSELGLQEIEGQMESLDRASRIVIIDGTPLRLTEETPVFVEGGVGSLDDLAEGEAVRASFVVEDGERVLHWIELPRPEEPVEIESPPEPAGQEVAR